MIQTQGLSFLSGAASRPSISCCGLLADDDGAVDALDHAVHAGVDTGAETLFGISPMTSPHPARSPAFTTAWAGRRCAAAAGCALQPGECAPIVGGQLHVAADTDLVDQAGTGTRRNSRHWV